MEENEGEVKPAPVHYEGIIAEVASLCERLISEKESFGTKTLENIHSCFVWKKFTEGATFRIVSLHKGSGLKSIMEALQEKAHFQQKITFERRCGLEEKEKEAVPLEESEV